MKRQLYYPSRIPDQITWLENWRNKLAAYGAALGLSPAQVAAGIADAAWLIYLHLSWLAAARAWSQACTKAMTDAETGDGTVLMVPPVFTPPAPPDGVVPVRTGALNRIFALVQLIKDSPGCTAAIITDLGLAGTEQTAPDFTTLAPDFTLTRLVTGIKVGWGWGGYAAFLDMIELQVDRNDGKGFVFLANDTTPGYLDTFPQPAAPVKWKYRAIFHVRDQRVGHWSIEKSITVGG
ncbi:MAG: hypothetical protein HZC54_02335 [Verrucomicrobia bacterium]|nr:hypothetical protein [Verrucomicrobiota bacterium]